MIRKDEDLKHLPPFHTIWTDPDGWVTHEHTSTVLVRLKNGQFAIGKFKRNRYHKRRTNKDVITFHRYGTNISLSPHRISWWTPLTLSQLPKTHITYEGVS